MHHRFHSVRVYPQRAVRPAELRRCGRFPGRQLLTFIALGLALACSGGLERPPGRPNILLLVVDSLRFDHVGAYGYGRPTTPRIDSLAADGIAFTRVFAQGNWTWTSVPAYLTGLYPSEHGLTEFDGRGGNFRSEALSANILTMAESLQAAGFRTAMVARQPQLAPRFQLDQGFDLYEHEARDAASIQGRLLDWLGEENDKPFFAYLHYLSIHWPYCPPPSTSGRFGSGQSGVEFCRGWRDLRRQILSGQLTLEPAAMTDMVARYDEELRALDAQIGRLLDALRERGWWRDTVVIVTSDHGEEFLEHGNIVHGHTLHDVLLHVPFIVRMPAHWPGDRGVQTDAMAELRNLPKTVADLARSPLEEALPGTSLLPWILSREPRRHVDEVVFAEDGNRITARSHRYRIIANRALTQASLFLIDIETGLLREVTRAEQRVKERLLSALRDWRGSLVSVEPGETTRLDERTRHQLEALGYLGD